MTTWKKTKARRKRKINEQKAAGQMKRRAELAAEREAAQERAIEDRHRQQAAEDRERRERFAAQQRERTEKGLCPECGGAVEANCACESAPWNKDKPRPEAAPPPRPRPAMGRNRIMGLFALTSALAVGMHGLDMPPSPPRKKPGR